MDEKPDMSIIDGTYDCHRCIFDAENWLDAWNHMVDSHGALEIEVKFDNPWDFRNGVLIIRQCAVDQQARLAGAI